MDRGIKKTEQDIAIARKFDKEFFDGDRKFGYGGYTYDQGFGIQSDLILLAIIIR